MFVQFLLCRNSIDSFYTKFTSPHLFRWFHSTQKMQKNGIKIGKENWKLSLTHHTSHAKKLACSLLFCHIKAILVTIYWVLFLKAILEIITLNKRRALLYLKSCFAQESTWFTLSSLTHSYPGEGACFCFCQYLHACDEAGRLSRSPLCDVCMFFLIPPSLQYGMYGSPHRVTYGWRGSLPTTCPETPRRQHSAARAKNSPLVINNKTSLHMPSVPLLSSWFQSVRLIVWLNLLGSCCIETQELRLLMVCINAPPPLFFVTEGKLHIIFPSKPNAEFSCNYRSEINRRIK